MQYPSTDKKKIIKVRTTKRKLEKKNHMFQFANEDIGKRKIEYGRYHVINSNKREYKRKLLVDSFHTI